MQVTINVPDSLRQITLQQYQKFIKINTEENQNTHFLLQKMVEIFCDIDLKDIAKIKYTDVQNIVQHLNKVFDVKTDLVKTFELNGVKFGFIPQLDDMTLGEYIDLDTYLGDWDNMHKAMAVLYRPIEQERKGKYMIREYEGTDTAPAMLDMPLDAVMGAMVFFYNLNSELLTVTLNYLSKEMEADLTLEQQRVLEESGVGIRVYMDYLKEILPSTIR
jgi:hypothetical protein